MKKIRMGILGAADIAVNRFLPALMLCPELEYVGVASKSGRNTMQIKQKFGGDIYTSYESILSDPTIDAVYIPLPPAYHFEWALKALESGKHVLLEKPFCICKAETLQLISCAREKKLAIVENFSFLYHNQIEVIKNFVDTGQIGEIRGIHSRFGYPRRTADRFRYNKELGGGALLDCGVYPIKLASIFLGPECKVLCSNLYTEEKSNVDLYGSVILTGNKKVTAQVSFGMENEYQCSVDIWGQQGRIYASRIFTAPDNLEPEISIIKSGVEKRIKVPSCNQFARILQHFKRCIENIPDREYEVEAIRLQSCLVEQIKQQSIASIQ